jgi:predicted HTH transcriptional regulator
MALDDAELDAITEADLVAAIADGLRPGKKVAFASAAYEHPFVKEVSSFANTSGGRLIIGIDAKDGSAADFAPLTGSPALELKRLEKRMQDGISPPVAGVRLKAVALARGGFVVVLQVPGSKQPPHRVSDPREPRSTLVYVRGGQGAIKLHPRAVDEWGW